MGTGKRFLPDPGGLLDQSSRLMQLFRIFDYIADLVTKQLMDQTKKPES